MLATVAMAGDALNFDDLPAAVVNGLSRTLVDRLLAHGALVFGNDNEALDFIRAVRQSPSLTERSRKQWEATLVELRSRRRLSAASPPREAWKTSVLEIRRGWLGIAEVAVVSPASAQALGLPADTESWIDGDRKLEITTVRSAADADAFTRIIEEARRGTLPENSTREQFWSVLKPLAGASTQAVIVDGYLLSAIVAIMSGRYRPHHFEHVSWMLDKLDGTMMPKSSIRLLVNTANLGGADPAQVAATLRELWAPHPRAGRLSQVTIDFCQGSYRGRRFPHDRHIRFSCGGGVRLHAGFDRLRDERVRDASGMSWNYLWGSGLQPLRDAERVAEELAERRETLPLNR